MMTPDQLADAADVTFLALVIWREARGEPYACRVQVGGCVLNRVHRPSWWGNSVTSVVFKKWQFSSVTDPHDPQLTTWPTTNDPTWGSCLLIAGGLLEGSILPTWTNADSYYDLSIPAPAWATPSTLCGQLGRMRFHNLDHDTELVARV